MNEYRIAVLNGDGIGPEIVAQAVLCLRAAAKRFGFSLIFETARLGGEAIDAEGSPLPDSTLAVCRRCDAVLLGAVGGPKWDGLTGDRRPEAGLLGIRSALSLYANFRPARSFAPLLSTSPLHPDILSGGIELLVVRELTGGIYFGQRGEFDKDGAHWAFDTEEYSIPQIERIARRAFDAARTRRGRVTSVDKANVLESSRLWRKTVSALAAEYPDIALDHLYVDNAAMQLVRAPGQFDVLLTSNLFGDILSDEAAAVCGSIGMLPSASLGADGFGLYEPVHGSAPDLAGKNAANPLAAILSAALLLRHSLGENEAAQCIEKAVDRVLTLARTADLAARPLPTVSTAKMGELTVQQIESLPL